MAEKELTDLEERINTSTSLIKEFKLFMINHLNIAFALSKTENNKIQNIEPYFEKSF